MAYALEVDPHVQITDETEIAALSLTVQMTPDGTPTVLTVPLTPDKLARLGAQVSRAIMTQVLTGAAIVSKMPSGRRATVVPIRADAPEQQEAE